MCFNTENKAISATMNRLNHLYFYQNRTRSKQTNTIIILIIIPRNEYDKCKGKSYGQTNAMHVYCVPRK